MLYVSRYTYTLYIHSFFSYHIQIDLVIGEPYFQSAVLPWHHVHFWYAVQQLSGLLSEQAAVFPKLLTIRAMAVCFRDLWKIRSPVGMCEGFNIQLFDDLVEVVISFRQHQITSVFLSVISNLVYWYTLLFFVLENDSYFSLKLSKRIYNLPSACTNTVDDYTCTG